MGWLTPVNVSDTEIRGMLTAWESEFDGHVAYVSAAPSHDSAFSRARYYASFWGNRKDKYFRFVPALYAAALIYYDSFVGLYYHEKDKVKSEARRQTEDILETAAVVAAAAAIVVIGPGAIFGAGWEALKWVGGKLIAPAAGAAVKPFVEKEVAAKAGEDAAGYNFVYEEKPFPTIEDPGIERPFADLLKDEDEGILIKVAEPKAVAGDGFFASIGALFEKTVTGGFELMKESKMLPALFGKKAVSTERAPQLNLGLILLLLIAGFAAVVLLFFLVR